MDDFKTGDKVSWRTAQGETQGEVIKIMTHEGMYGSLEITASKRDPRYIVRSEKSGKLAAHRATALHRL